MNAIYATLSDLPATLPLFPLSGALLLPRGRMPLNIFEPRYLALVEAALAGDRMIGMIQPDDPGGEATIPKLFGVGCAGRIVQFAETGDGRNLVVLAGIARFRVVSEETADTPYRQARANYAPFASDLEPGAGEDDVDRGAVLDALRTFTDATGVDFDWDNVEKAGNEVLVNALCMLAPFGIREKQALLEASDLKIRAATLVALTEIELARSGGSQSQTTLQ